MIREKKDHPVLFPLKIAALLLLVAFPITALKLGYSLWSGKHDKKSNR